MVNLSTLEIIATACGYGSTPDFRMFKEHYAGMAQAILCLAEDTGYLGINKRHANSQIPAKNSKLHKLTPEQKTVNRELISKRIFCEHVIGRLQVLRILSDKYRHRRKCFTLRFNLIVPSTTLNSVLNHDFCKKSSIKLANHKQIQLTGVLIPYLSQYVLYFFCRIGSCGYLNQEDRRYAHIFLHNLRSPSTSIFGVLSGQTT
jgi:hypothetical protein